MYGFITLSVLLGYGIFSVNATEKNIKPISQNVARTLQRLWNSAHDAIRQSQYLKAEKALLHILRLDKSNASAYNRLGIIYARQSEYHDAIDCFNIARSIAPNPQSLHNLGLVYYLSEDYKKSTQAFQNAIAIDGGTAQRYQALSKSLEKEGKKVASVKALEQAYKSEPSERYKSLLLSGYNNIGDSKRHDKLAASPLPQPTEPTRPQLLPGRGGAVKKRQRLQPRHGQTDVNSTSQR